MHGSMNVKFVGSSLVRLSSTLIYTKEHTKLFFTICTEYICPHLQAVENNMIMSVIKLNNDYFLQF